MKTIIFSFIITFAEARSIYPYKNICDKLDEENYILTKKIMNYEFCKKNINDTKCKNNKDKLQEIKKLSEERIKNNTKYKKCYE